MGAALASCDKKYDDYYGSLYYYDSYGERQCRMIESYNLNNDPGYTRNDNPFVKSICVYYSGHWTVEILDECEWAYLSKSEGTGVHYFNFCYEQNTTGEDRCAIVRLTCDNGEELDITLNQSSL